MATNKLPANVFRKAAKLQSVEGKPRKQAIAIAANMNREGRLSKEGSYVRKSR